MEFWLWWIATLVLGAVGYIVAETIIRRSVPRYIKVSITDKNGVKRSILLNVGVDPEVQRLVDAVRRNKASKA